MKLSTEADDRGYTYSPIKTSDFTPFWNVNYSTQNTRISNLLRIKPSVSKHFICNNMFFDWKLRFSIKTPSFLCEILAISKEILGLSKIWQKIP